MPTHSSSAGLALTLEPAAEVDRDLAARSNPFRAVVDGAVPDWAAHIHQVVYSEKKMVH